MTKAKSKQASSERIKFAQPRDPNRCFVYFPSTYFTAGTVSVGLESLRRQVEQIGSERTVKQMEYSPAERKLTIEFEGDAI